MTTEPERGTLKLGEPHPVVYDAMAWLNKKAKDLSFIILWQESFSSCALAGNRLAEICSKTLSRVLDKKSVSDKYLLGLVYYMRSQEFDKSTTKRKMRRARAKNRHIKKKKKLANK